MPRNAVNFLLSCKKNVINTLFPYLIATFAAKILKLISMKKILLSSLLLAFLCVQTRAQLVINELMQSNIDCIMDDLNEFPDW